MSRRYFISVECDGNDFEMTFQSSSPTSQQRPRSRLNCVRTAIPILYSLRTRQSSFAKFRFGRRSEGDAEETCMKIYCFTWHAISIPFVNCFLDNSAGTRDIGVKLRHNPQTRVEFVIDERACGIGKFVSFHKGLYGYNDQCTLHFIYTQRSLENVLVTRLFFFFCYRVLHILPAPI